jgi:hypothetical protein
VLIYWSLFAYFAVGALFAPARPTRGTSVPFMLGGIATAVLIGLRYQVGADWPTYEFWFSFAGGHELAQVLKFGDPGYQIVNWLVQQLGFRLWLMNLICGAIFSWGLLRFCKSQPEPWLAIAVAIPYMVIVVAMGYSRQAVALGILMAGLASFKRDGSALRFAIYVVFAAFFHRTAVVAFPLVALASPRNRFLNLLVAVAGGVMLYDAFLGDAMDNFVKNYIQRGYSSQGAAIRIIMTLVAALIFWLAGKRMGFSETEWKLWRNFSLAALAGLILLLVVPSSTAVDRLSIYIMPLQLAVLSRIPAATNLQLVGRAAVIGYAAAVEFVWLNFAQHASFWVPYRFFPL